MRGMNPEKIKFLTELAEQIEHTPKDQLMAKFMTLNMEANAKNIQFNDQETDLLVGILTANMSPAERSKVDTLRMLSKKLSQKK